MINIAVPVTCLLQIEWILVLSAYEEQFIILEKECMSKNKLIKIIVNCTLWKKSPLLSYWNEYLYICNN